jgi:twitching motility two-component system response regulator PilG
MFLGSAAKKQVETSHLLLREVVAAAKQGQKQMAQDLLHRIMEDDPANEQALLWAAALSDSPEEGAGYLEEVLRINPDNRQALNTLALQRLNVSIRPQRAAGGGPVSHHHREERPRISLPAAPPPPPPQLPPPAQTAKVTPIRRPSVTTAQGTEKIINFANLLKRNWACPLCEQDSTGTAKSRCSHCGAYLIVEDLHGLSANRGVDERLLTEAIQKLEAKAAVQPHHEIFYNIARAQLNLNRSAEAVTNLRKALELKPSDATLRVLAELLEQRKLVMAVDDSYTLRRILSITLERYGLRVITACDGMQALALLNEYRPDMILLDITMPRMDGYQVCKVIRQNKLTRNLPVVMLSGNDGFFDKVKGKMAGATDYITKPFEEEKLLGAVRKYSTLKQ